MEKNMQTQSKQVRQALRGRQYRTHTQSGKALTLPVVFTNHGKEATTIKAIFPTCFYTQEQAQSALEMALHVAAQANPIATATLRQEFYWGLHCAAYIVRIRF